MKEKERKRKKKKEKKRTLWDDSMSCLSESTASGFNGQ